MLQQSTKRVAIIGGGVAGLQSLKALRRIPGVSAVVFEAGTDVGGVWHDNYANAGLQVPKSLYEFPDYEMKGYASSHVASAEEVQKYVKDYVKDNKLGDSIRLNTRVTKIAAIPGPNNNGNENWAVTTSDGNITPFDDVVVATGMYSRPFLPSVYSQFLASSSSSSSSPPQKKQQQVFHASEVTRKVLLEQLKGKRVVVVGSAKSAQDIAEALSTSAAGPGTKVTMLYRNAHWGAPLKIAGLIPFQYVFLSRFGQALVSLSTGIWPEAAKSSPTLASASRSSILASAVAPVFSIVEALFSVQLGLKGEFRPRPGIVKDFYGYAHLPSSGFVRALGEKKFDLVKGEVEAIKVGAAGSELTLTLNKSTAAPSTITCDAVVCATGFEKAYAEVFDSATLSKLAPEPDGLYLYRHIVSPRLPHLYFCGSETATISNIATDFVQAKWIAQAVGGKLALPSAAEMDASVEAMKKWKRSWMPATSARAAMVLLHMTHYHDTLLGDMGVNPARKSNPLAEALMPYTPADYRAL